MVRRGVVRGIALVALLWTGLGTGGSRLSAQDPAAPTAKDLEIYALAVDSADYPEEVVVLLQEREVRVEGDGTWSTRIRVVRQVLEERAVAPLAELAFTYEPTREEFSLNWARVVNAQGTVLSAEPIHTQELDQPVSRTAPIYSSVKQFRASLGGVARGTIVDWQYTERTVNPPLPGDIFVTWGADQPTPVRRTRFVLDTPDAFDLRIEETNLSGPTEISEGEGRTVRTWYFEDPTKVEPEPFAGTPNDVVRSVTVSAAMEWDDISRWYGGLAADRYELTPALREQVATAVSGATTLVDSLKAVHRWIAQDIRYASISLGIAGYQPRPAGEVALTGVGDCKDKATLFIAIAREMGAEAYPVIVNLAGKVDPTHTTIRQFNHMIASVWLDEEWVHLDLTVPVSPWGHIHSMHQGDAGVLLRDDGSAEVIDFPMSPATENRSSIIIDGALNSSGGFEGTYTESVSGMVQYRLRSEFARALNSETRAQVARNLANRVSRQAETDSLELFDGLDLDAEPRLWAHIVGDSILEPVPGGWMLRVPLPGYGSRELIAQLKEDTLRAFPINSAAVFGVREHFTELRYRLPQGWSADLPESVRAESPFGLYETTYTFEDGELLIRRIVRGNDALLSPDQVAELIDWLQLQFDDRIDHVILRPSAGAP